MYKNIFSSLLCTWFRCFCLPQRTRRLCLANLNFLLPTLLSFRERLLRASLQRRRVRRVKAKLYPLNNFSRFLEFLVERLPRRVVDLQFSLAEDLITFGAGEYRSTGVNPSFAVEPIPGIMSGGWFYLECALVRHTGEREAALHGFGAPPACRKFSCPIPSNLRGTIREVVFIPPQATSIYWSPMRGPGFFSQSEILLHQITALEAWLRRAHRVLLFGLQNPIGRFGRWRQIGRALFNLRDAYEETAWIQIRRYRGLQYAEFLARREREVTLAVTEGASRLARSASRIPLLSVLIHVDAAVQEPLLCEALESLRAQRYREWEALVLVEPHIPAATRELLAAQAWDCRQIRLLEPSHTLGETAWFARALEATRGYFIGVLGAHDLLTPHALLLVADALLQHPDASLLYADHDSIRADGIRFDPCFKPDWNPDWLAAQNYIGQPCFFKSNTLRRLGGYRADFAPAHAYDLLLRACFSVESTSIFHIPQIIYHRRTVPHGPEVTSAEHEAGKRALQDVLGEHAVGVEHGLIRGTYHVRRPVPDPAPLVSIIVPTRDKLDVLKACVDSVRSKTTYRNWELLIVDNCSQEGETLAWLHAQEADSRVRVLSDPRPFNYSALNNEAVRQSAGDVIVLLNNDVEVIEPHWLSELVSHAVRPEIGAVGAKLLYPNHMVQHAGVVLGIGGVAGHVHRYLGGDDPGYMCRAMVTQNFSVVTAACLAVRKKTYLEIGGLDEQDLRIAFNDVDFCLKLIRAGYRNLFTPYALLFHHESLSRGHDDTQEKQAIFKHEFSVMKRRLGGFVDPAYNPNLSLEFEDFSLRRN